jgi:uncharacterized membrane protein
MKELEETVRVVTLSLGSVVEGIAAIVIATGVLKGVISYVRSLVFVKLNNSDVRVELGKILAVSLEFLLAADILRTAVSPTWADIGKLASIAILRTLLNFFLDRELNIESRSQKVK